MAFTMSFTSPGALGEGGFAGDFEDMFDAPNIEVDVVAVDEVDGARVVAAPKVKGDEETDGVPKEEDAECSETRSEERVGIEA